MSLPARQQHVLDRIEGALQASEPHMASMFTTFTRLTRDEGPAGTEQLRGSWLPNLRQFGLIPVMLAMLLTGALLSSTAHGAARCGDGRLSAVALAGERGPVRSVVLPACDTQPKPATPVTPAP